MSDPTPPVDSATCPDNTWTAKGNRCYKVISLQNNRVVASAYCNSLGAQLAQIRNFQESLFIDSLNNIVDANLYVSFCFKFLIPLLFTYFYFKRLTVSQLFPVCMFIKITHRFKRLGGQLVFIINYILSKFYFQFIFVYVKR